MKKKLTQMFRFLLRKKTAFDRPPQDRNDTPSKDVSKGHPAHQHQLKYVTMCIEKEEGPEFDFKTLKEISGGNMYWMSEAEINKRIVFIKSVNKK